MVNANASFESQDLLEKHMCKTGPAWGECSSNQLQNTCLEIFNPENPDFLGHACFIGVVVKLDSAG